MNRIRLASIPIVLIIILITSASIASATEQFPINGNVVNETANATFIDKQLVVSLHIFDGAIETATFSSSTGPTGDFQITGATQNDNYTYFLTTDYEGVSYSTTISPGRLSEPVTLTVYEPTDDPTVLLITDHTLLITGADPDERFVEILERVVLSNPTDRTFLADLEKGGMPQMLRFGLPESAYNLDVRSSLVGGEVLQVDKGFAITTPVPPTSNEAHHLEYIYRVPYEADLTVDIGRSLRFNTKVFKIVLPQTLADLKAPQFNDMGSIDLGTRELRLLEGTDFKTDAELELQLSNLPDSAFFSRMARKSGRWYRNIVAPSLVLVGLAGALVIVLIRRRIRKSKNTGFAGIPDAEDLVKQIAEIDAAYESNRIPHRKYAHMRAQLKQKLFIQEAERQSSERIYPD